MAERLRIFRGSTELDYSRAIYKKSWDKVVDSAKIEIVKEPSVIIGGTIDFKKADGTTTVFSASVIDKVQVDIWKLDLLSQGYELNNIPILKVYENTSPEAIVQDIVDNFTVGLTYASSSVSGITIKKHIAKGYLIDVIQDMGIITGWQLRIDESGNVYFEPRGNVDNGRTLTNGIDFNIEDWEDDNTDMFNHVRVVGNLTNVKADQDDFTGDASETEFTLTQKPVGDVNVTVDGTRKTPGVDGTGDYVVDHEQKKIIFTVAPGNLLAILVDYNFQIRVVVDDQDDDSIASYGEIFKEFQSPATDTFEDARQLAAGLLQEFSTPKKKPKGAVTGLDFTLDVGEIVKVADSVRNITESVVIYSLKYDTQTNQTFVTTGRKKPDLMDSLDEMKERIKKLEQRTTDDEVTAFSRISKHDMKVSMNLETFYEYSCLADNFILGHQTLGRLRADLDFEADCSDNDNNGTWQGSDIAGSQYATNGFRLSDGDFNGSDNYITVTHAANLNSTSDFTIALAVRVETLPGAVKYLLNKWDGTDGYAVRINASNKVELIYSKSGADTIFAASTGLTAKAYQHVVFIKSDTSLTVYVNGVSDNTATESATVGTNSNAFEVGRYSANYFTGRLDEVRFYNENILVTTVGRIFNKTDINADDWSTLAADLTCYLSMDNPRLGDRSGSRQTVSTSGSFLETFRQETFKGSPSNADWNTSLRRLAMNDKTNHNYTYNTIATSLVYGCGGRSLATVTFTSNETRFGNDVIRYGISTDDGSNWKWGEHGETIDIEHTGNQPLWKVIFMGNGGRETYIRNLRMSFTLV